MANTDTPQGFRPLNPYAKTHRYVAATSANIFRGDAVTLESDGNITVAAAGNELLGVAAAFFTATGTPVIYHTTSYASGEVEVWDDPDEVFICQDDGVGTAAAQTHVGNSADLVATHSGNTSSGLSGQELDISTVTTAASGQWQIMGLANEFDSTGPNAWGSWAKILVRPHEHIYAATTITGV